MTLKQFIDKEIELKNRKIILKKAYEYLKHEDEFVRIFAQIVIFHYGDK